ncbi:hypothetical protein LINGRAHAP2_LOCUS22356, partial [Linum grandiflorum]
SVEGEIYDIRNLAVIDGDLRPIPKKELYLWNISYIAREPEFRHRRFPINGHESISFDQFTPQFHRRDTERIGLHFSTIQDLLLKSKRGHGMGMRSLLQFC